MINKNEFFKMKKFIIGLVIGASLTGSSVLAVDLAKGSGNPISHLPLQTQLDRVIDAVDSQFDAIHEGFQNVGTVLIEHNQRLAALEAKK